MRQQRKAAACDGGGGSTGARFALRVPPSDACALAPAGRLATSNMKSAEARAALERSLGTLEAPRPKKEYTMTSVPRGTQTEACMELEAVPVLKVVPRQTAHRPQSLRQRVRQGEPRLLAGRRHELPSLFKAPHRSRLLRCACSSRRPRRRAPGVAYRLTARTIRLTYKLYRVADLPSSTSNVVSVLV